MKKGIEVIRCKCGNIYSACDVNFTDQDWEDEISEAKLKGHTVEVINSPFSFKHCTCVKELSICDKVKKLMEYGVPASVIYKELKINERTFTSRVKGNRGFKKPQEALFEARWGSIFAY